MYSRIQRHLLVDNDSNYSFVSGFADGAVQVIEHTFVPDPDTIPIIITSNNTNKMYAKAGDNITVQIKLNVTANNYTASILNETLFTHVTNSSKIVNASVIVRFLLLPRFPAESG